ncbi:hypothetical protein F4803DRAFT_66516 [Xylaria telfairii]|nr:hypothetical protein F4803DRAFT_66516 [Xylaria telfairii]
MQTVHLSRLPRARVAYYVLLLGLIPLAQAQWPARQLENFFPAWDHYLRDLIATKCSNVLAADLQAITWAPYDTIECLLDAFPEYRKSEIGASSVALGLLPTMLSLLGPSITDQAVLATRRPFLSLLLATGSPAVNPQLDDEYTASIEKKLCLRKAASEQSRNAQVSSTRIFVVSLVEHVAAIGAVVNVVILAYQLSIFTVTSFSVKFGYLPAVWVGLSIPIHLASYVALRLRMKKPERKEGNGRDNDLFSFWAASFAAEFTPCEYHQPKTLEWGDEDQLHYKAGRALTWLLNFGIVAHIIFGTLTLSGLLFISAADAIGVVARFFASTLVSQWIFAYELSGIEKTTFLKGSVSTPPHPSATSLGMVTTAV